MWVKKKMKFYDNGKLKTYDVIPVGGKSKTLVVLNQKFSKPLANEIFTVKEKIDKIEFQDGYTLRRK